MKKKWGPACTEGQEECGVARNCAYLHAVFLARAQLLGKKAPDLHKEAQGKDEDEGQQLPQGLIEEHRPAAPPFINSERIQGRESSQRVSRDRASNPKNKVSAKRPPSS